VEREAEGGRERERERERETDREGTFAFSGRCARKFLRAHASSNIRERTADSSGSSRRFLTSTLHPFFRPLSTQSSRSAAPPSSVIDEEEEGESRIRATPCRRMLPVDLAIIAGKSNVTLRFIDRPRVFAPCEYPVIFPRFYPRKHRYRRSASCIVFTI